MNHFISGEMQRNGKQPILVQLFFDHNYSMIYQLSVVNILISWHGLNIQIINGYACILFQIQLFSVNISTLFQSILYSQDFETKYIKKLTKISIAYRPRSNYIFV